MGAGKWGGLALGSLPHLQKQQLSVYVFYSVLPCKISFEQRAQLRRNLETTGIIQIPSFTHEKTRLREDKTLRVTQQTIAESEPKELDNEILSLAFI